MPCFEAGLFVYHFVAVSLVATPACWSRVIPLCTSLGTSSSSSPSDHVLSLHWGPLFGLSMAPKHREHGCVPTNHLLSRGIPGSQQVYRNRTNLQTFIHPHKSTPPKRNSSSIQFRAFHAHDWGDIASVVKGQELWLVSHRAGEFQDILRVKKASCVFVYSLIVCCSENSQCIVYKPSGSKDILILWPKSTCFITSPLMLVCNHHG